MNMAPPEPNCDLSQAEFARLAGFIVNELGIKMPDCKLTMLHSRLLRRVRELNLRSMDQYSEYLFNALDTEERDHFINAVTTNKTDFFREPEHFRFLVETALSNLGRSAPANWRAKFWSAGCSSGEEAYTLAMVLSEFAQRRPGFEFAILATDVSTRVLEQARNGIYPEVLAAPIAPELRRKYLLHNRNTAHPLVRVKPELRSKVHCHRLNFMDDDYRIRDLYDVIFFRNVMIYFEKTTQEAVIRKLCRNLVPGGYLFVGHSESLAGLDIPVVSVRPSIFRKIGSGKD